MTGPGPAVGRADLFHMYGIFGYLPFSVLDVPQKRSWLGMSEKEKTACATLAQALQFQD